MSTIEKRLARTQTHNPRRGAHTPTAGRSKAPDSQAATGEHRSVRMIWQTSSATPAGPRLAARFAFWVG